MEIRILDTFLASGRLDIEKLRKLIKETGNVYTAIRESMEVEKNNLFEQDHQFIDVAYSEVDWGTFFMILDKFPEKKEMKLAYFPVKYSGLVSYKKDSINMDEGIIKLSQQPEKEGEDYILVGAETMRDIDSWIDSFISGRVYNPFEDE